MLRERVTGALLAGALVLAACSSDAPKDVTAKGGDTTAAPTTEASAPAAPAVSADGCPVVPARAKPRPDRSKYALTVNIKPDQNVVDGTVTVQFTPDLPTDKLVFRLWPNGPRPASGGAKLTASGITVNGQPGQVKGIDATTMEVRAAAPFAAGKTVTAAMSWQLTLPGPTQDRISRSGNAIRLGSFFPILSWEPGRGWATEPPTAGFAEASTVATADFTATITAPPGLDILASGVPDGNGHWSAPLMADFAISAGKFKLAEAMVNAPNPVKVIVGVDETMSESAQAYLDKSVKVLADFGTRFGPYPWPVYTLALTPNLGGGIEYPTHVMQGPRTLGRTTSHEIGHQWFYGLVENNQGRDPFIDEGLATWAEYRFEGKTEALLARKIPAAGRGKVDSPMTFWEDKRSIYYDGVYIQGAQTVAALGPAEKVDCALRHFVARNAYRVSTRADLISAMNVVFPDALTVMAKYGVHG